MKDWLIQYSMNKKIIRTIFIVLLTIQNTLGIVNVFVSPIPIPPRTSIGIMTGIAACMVALLCWALKKKIIKLNSSPKIIDYYVLLFIIMNAISLLWNDTIFEPTKFRLLIIGVLQYIVLRIIAPTQKEKMFIFHSLGVVVVIVSSINLFQLLFRPVMIQIAKQYFFGEMVYGIAWELQRGRIPFWGNNTILFPAFTSLICFPIKSTVIRWVVILGLILIPFSFVVSNFRWIMTCFFLGMVILFYFSKELQMFFLEHIQPTLLVVTGSLVIGLIFSTVFSRYNLINRFLFQDKARDVTYSIGRLYLYNQALEVFKAFPVVGVGVGNYPYYVDPIEGLAYFHSLSGKYDESDKQPVSSHNEPLTILVEIGVVGAAWWLMINIYVFQRAVTLLRSKYFISKSDLFVISISFTSLCLYYLFGLFENVSPNNYIYIFFLFGIIVSQHNGRDQRS